MNDLEPKKRNLRWVDQTAQKIKRDTLKALKQNLATYNLQDQFRIIVRVCPMNPGTDPPTQNLDGCGCGCAA